MKKILALILMLSFVVVSCTPTSLNDDQIQATDKDKVCPPGQPDC